MLSDLSWQTHYNHLQIFAYQSRGFLSIGAVWAKGLFHPNVTLITGTAFTESKK